MFYLLYPLADVFSPFNLFRYLTFRSIAAFLTALVLSFLIGGGLIRWLRSKQKQGQPIRDDGPASHLVNKKGTPTMGGLLILITLTIATLLWADLTNPYVWIVLGVTLTFGAVGFWDDFLKVTKRNPKGVPGKLKLALVGRRRRACRLVDRTDLARAAALHAGGAVPEGRAAAAGRGRASWPSPSW